MSKAKGAGNILAAVQSVKSLKSQIRNQNEMGTFTDQDHKKIATLEKKIVDTKTKAAKDLLSSHKPPKKKFNGDEDAMSELEDFLEELTIETDIKQGNLELFKAMLTCTAIDVPSLCESRGLLATAAADGSKGYIETLLSHNPPVKFDAVEVLSTAFFNQQCRIPLALLMLKYEKVLGLGDLVDDLTDVWEEFFADICSKKRAIPREDRTGRLQLIEKMAANKYLKLDRNAEGGDGQTVFSRAAHEADTELLRLLMKIKLAPDVNRVQGDNTTTLIQAVFSNNLETVNLILSQSGIDLNHSSDDGTALALAVVLQRDHEIVKALKAKGATEGSTQPTLKKAPTFAVPKREPHPPSGTSPEPNPRQTAVDAAAKAQRALEEQKVNELKEMSDAKGERRRTVRLLDPIDPNAGSPTGSNPGSLNSTLNGTLNLSMSSSGSKALLDNKKIAIKFYERWQGIILSKRTTRRKSMMQKVIMFGGTTTAKLRMYFTDWKAHAMQQKLQKRMGQIRDTIAKRHEARKQKKGGLTSVSPESSASPRPGGGSKKGGGDSKFSLMSCVELIRLTKMSVQSMNAMGTFTDEEHAKTNKALESIQDMKLNAATALTLAKSKFSPTEEEDETLQDFFEDLITDTDIKKGNLELCKAFLKSVDLDFPTIAEERGLVAIAACDGSRGYLEALLGVPNVKFDTVEVLSSAFFNQECRIPLTLILLKFEKVLKLDEFVDDIKDIWEEFFADIASQKRSIPREDRTGRIELLEKMIKHRTVRLDMDAEGPDAQTVFTRAAHEGDTELMRLLLHNNAVADVNKVQSDGTTGLIQAVFSNKVDAVKLLLSNPSLDINYESSDGSAITIAKTLKRDPAIAKALSEYGASDGKSKGGGKTTIPNGVKTPRPPSQQKPTDKLPSVGKKPAATPAAKPEKRSDALGKLMTGNRKAELKNKLKK